ncbi:MAG: hypothetical protein PHP02_09040 [Eubacteriales bacterium]|nr:hypothetical protein [Eubacteriales bacterium]
MSKIKAKRKKSTASQENPKPNPYSSLEGTIQKITVLTLRVGVILSLLLLIGGIFYRPFLYAGLLILLFMVLGFAFSTPLTKKDFLAMIWWEQKRK